MTKRKDEREWIAFLQRKVEAARASIAAGRGRSEEAVKGDMAAASLRQALIEGERSGEAERFDFTAFQQRKCRQHG